MLRFADFDRVVFFTGAGLSAESGIPTYRGKGGLWAEYNYEDYACAEAFARAPEKVWDFHDQRREMVASKEPNKGHDVIVALQKARGDKVTAITQNIDGMLDRAGATDVVELHGSLWRVRCDRCNVFRADVSVPMSPRTHECGYWRPDIVWFGDQLDHRKVRRVRELLESLTSNDLFVSVGTSAAVYPAAAMPEMAMAAGATTVEVNLEDTPMSHLYQHRLRGMAGDVLVQLAAG